jgi:hypothetical protein
MSNTFTGGRKALEIKPDGASCLLKPTTRRQKVSQERLSVRKIREVHRLHHEAGLSNRGIARVFRQVKTDPHMALCRQMVDLV